MTTIGQTVSRVRNSIKAVKIDAYITDQYLYALIIKYGKAMIRIQDNVSQILKFNMLFRTLPCVDLIESNYVEACCGNVTSDCPIKRTKDKVPQVVESTFGAVIRSVTSIDGQTRIEPTTPESYASMTKTSNFKYNKSKYYWIINGYFYFPDLAWEAVKIDAVFEGELANENCEDECLPRQDQPMPIPDYMFADIEKNVLAEIAGLYQIPVDAQIDKQSGLR